MPFDTHSDNFFSGNDDLTQFSAADALQSVARSVSNQQCRARRASVDQEFARLIDLLSFFRDVLLPLSIG
jgi:hypothetical protein